MSEWKKCKMGDMADINMGQSPESKYYNYIEKGLPFLQGNRTFGTRFPYFDTFCSNPKKIANKGEILFSVRAPVGDINIANTKICIGRGLASLNAKNRNNAFLFYLLYYLKNSIINTESGTVFGSVSKDDLERFELLLPPIPEQTAIASVLSSLDDKIDLLHRQNKTLEAMTETLFRQWFVEEAIEASNKYILLGDIIESISIKHEFPKNNVIFLNTSDIYLGQILTNNYYDIQTLPGQAKKSIKKDDILFSEIRPANGRWAYVDFDAHDYVVSTKLMVFRAKGKIDPTFIYFYITHPNTVEWLQLIAEARSGTFPQITFEQIKELKINIPSEKLLTETIDWCKKTLKKIKHNQSQIRTLEKLRDTLLPKLISGEVRVKI